MVAVAGTYKNGVVKLDKHYISKKPLKVIVTFLEDVEVDSTHGITLSDFSFAKSQKVLENYTGSFSEKVSEERRSV